MKQLYIFLFTALTLIGLSSCSTYRSSATPDDVYGSPDVSNNGYSTYSQGNSDYYSTPNDNYVRMRVQDPDRWSTFDNNNYDYYGGGYSNLGYASPYYSGMGYGYGGYGGYGTGLGFGYSPFFGTGLGFGYGLGYYDSYYLWNSYYNPYYGGVVVVNGHNAGTTPVTRAANFNPASYRGRSVSTRPAFSNRSSSGGQVFSPNNAAGLRRANYYNNNSSNSANWTRPGTNSATRPSYNNSVRPAQPTQTYSQPVRSAPSNFGGGGGGGGRAGGMSRPGR